MQCKAAESRYGVLWELTLSPTHILATGGVEGWHLAGSYDHFVTRVQIRSFSGPHFPVEYGDSIHKLRCYLDNFFAADILSMKKYNQSELTKILLTSVPKINNWKIA